MKRVMELKPGDELWLYTIEPNESCFPIKEERYVIDEPLTSWTIFHLINESGKKETRTINVLDAGINARARGKIYIWLTERDYRKAFEIVKEHYMNRLVAVTDQLKDITQIFSNMEGWVDVFKCEDKFSFDWSHAETEEEFD